MKSKTLLSIAALTASFTSLAQDANKTYAITGKASNKFLWSDIKQIDITSGKIINTLFEADKTTYKIKSLDNSPISSQQEMSPTNFGVAAAALDVRTNRLFFASMHLSDIRYLDLNKATPEFTIIKRNIIEAPADKPYQPEQNHFTRMVIGADGFGYAVTNDGNHFIRFSTGRTPIVQDLGSLVDAEANKGISIHNKCTSWGGDMLADAFGKLIIISANHNVFSVDVKTKVTTYVGAISGLPAAFTTNGAVADADGNMIVSSANVFEALYKVNYKTLTAVKVESTEPAFNASDLANGNMLLQKEADASSKFDVSKSTLPVFEMVGDAKVFPNPVTADQFNVSFEGMAIGKYTILFTDLAGRPLQSKVVSIKGNQIETVKLSNKTPKGMYIVNVMGEDKKLAFSQRVVIQ
jgi:lipocalin